MDEREKLQQQMSEIGDRYLKRTLDEMQRLRQLADQVRSGESQSMTEIEHMAHKIHGSGAMFGFDAISDLARAIELLVGAQSKQSDFMQRLQTCIESLDQQVQSSARTRGLQ